MVSRLVKISDSAYHHLQQFIIEDANSWHKGSIKETVEAAIRFYISYKQNQRQDTHTYAHKSFGITKEFSNVPKRLLRQRDQIVEYLEREYYIEADLLKRYGVSQRAVILTHLKEAISFVIGSDKRTVSNALQMLHKFRLMKEVSTNMFEFAPFCNDLIEAASAEEANNLR